MHCLALSLDSKSNTILHKIGKEVHAFQKTSMMIEYFHLTLICSNDFEDCENFINEFKEHKSLFEKVKPLKFLLLEGKNTDFDYLAVEVSIPCKIKQEILRLREKNLSKELNNFILKPHISVVKAPKGTLNKEVIDLLNIKYCDLASFKIKDVLIFSHDFKLIKKTKFTK